MKTIKIKKLLGRSYNWVRSRNATNILQLVVYFTGIVTFITATAYFSEKPSVKINVTTFPKVNVDPVLVRDFYQKARIKAPDLLLKHSLFGELFNEPTVQEINYITERENPFWWLGQFPPYPGEINDLEGLLKKQDWYKLIWSVGCKHPIGSIYLDEAQKNLETIKSKLSPKDYRNFIASLLYARMFESFLQITNDGDFDLRDVVITISAPLTRTTESRDNNILSVKTNDVQPNDIRKHKDRVEIFLPALKKRHGFSVWVQTRENRIKEQEVFSSFQEDRVVSHSRIGFISLIIFIFMALVKLICRGKHHAQGDN